MVAETTENGGTTGAVIAVGEVQSAGQALPAPDLSGVKQIIAQTKALGIILPPPDIRAIIDKTAQFVSRNGVEFEKRILANEQNNVKFNFLRPTDPYHAYYRMRVTNFTEGEKAEAGEGGDQEQPGGQAAPAPAVVVPAVVPPPAKVLEKPEDEHYMVHVPEGLTALDLDIIRLTAQFAARNGTKFLTGLAEREHSNPLFYFLKPGHSMFTFFTALGEAYSRVMQPADFDKNLMSKLGKDVEDRGPILERCLKRLEWEQHREREAQEVADEVERERLAMLSIDWHDFVVVETIDFYEDEDTELPPPLTLREVLQMNKARTQGLDQVQEEEEGAAANGTAREEDMDMDEEEKAILAEAAAASALGSPGPSSLPPVADAAPELLDMEQDDDEAPIRVVRNYQRVTKTGQTYDPTKFVVSPITGELVAIEDMAEHMRISLMDPQWKEQREAMMAKIKDNTKADDDEIGRNLLSLARTRPDIFGTTEEEVTQAVSSSIQEKMTSGVGRPVVWDGQTQGGEALQHQRKAIQESRQELLAARAAEARMTPHPLGPINSGPPPVARSQQLPPPVRPPALGGFNRGPLPPPVMPPPMRPPGLAPPLARAVPPGPIRPPMPGGLPGLNRPGPLLGPPRLPIPGAPPMGSGVPAPPREAPPPIPDDEPDSKRARTDFILEAEEEFLAKFSGASKVRVQCPEVEGNEKLFGQILEVEVASLEDTVGQFKSRLADVLDLPANKQKLNREGVGFLRDDFSLAHYNVSPEVVLTLGMKERGGRKK